MRLIGGSSHPELTDLIAKKVGVRAGKVVLGKFANNETNVQLQEQVRGQDVYIIQTGEAVIMAIAMAKIKMPSQELLTPTMQSWSCCS